jgi:hypothetical protein
VKLPPAKEILAALEAADRPRSLPAVRSWTSGKIGMPFDVLLVLDWHRSWGLVPAIDAFARAWLDAGEFPIPFGAFLKLAEKRDWQLHPELEEFARRWRSHAWRKRGAS